MPEGIIQWFDAQAHEAVIASRGRRYPARGEDVEAGARRPGTRVHFDIRREGGVEWATRIEAAPRRGVTYARRGFAGLTDSGRVGPKGPAPLGHTRRDLSHVIDSHPLEIGSLWARCLAVKDLEATLALYAPQAVVHDGDETVSSRSAISTYLASSPFFGSDAAPDIRGDNGLVVLSWHDGEGDQETQVRLAIEHARIVEQWVSDESTPAAIPGGSPFAVVTAGDVTDDSVAYAEKRLQPVITAIEDPVLFARLKLSQAADPARSRPADAQITVDVDGEVVRARVAAPLMHEAIDLLKRRLEDKLEHRARRHLAGRQRTGIPEPGNWRRGDLPSDRPDYYDRPVDERELVRHKTYVADDMTVDEAVFALEELDYGFLLYRDLASGSDAVVSIVGDDRYTLQLIEPGDGAPESVSVPVEISTASPPRMTVEQAIDRLDLGADRFQFFENTASGRGNVIYRRYDGHYGLITPD